VLFLYSERSDERIDFTMMCGLFFGLSALFGAVNCKSALIFNVGDDGFW